MKTPDDFDPKTLTGRNRRLLHEWRDMAARYGDGGTISFVVDECNPQGLPTAYRVHYDLWSVCGIDDHAAPVFAKGYELLVQLPSNYPCLDGAPRYSFLTSVDGRDINHPWHPNIRYYGAFAGRVCLNAPDTFSSIAWAVGRIADYLRYDRYHAHNEPPYPEDLTVAQWVESKGEPEGLIFFSQEELEKDNR